VYVEKILIFSNPFSSEVCDISEAQSHTIGSVIIIIIIIIIIIWLQIEFYVVVVVLQ
jgi:hypothetical protein